MNRLYRLGVRIFRKYAVRDTTAYLRRVTIRKLTRISKKPEHMLNRITEGSFWRKPHCSRLNRKKLKKIWGPGVPKRQVFRPLLGKGSVPSNQTCFFRTRYFYAPTVQIWCKSVENWLRLGRLRQTKQNKTNKFSPWQRRWARNKKSLQALQYYQLKTNTRPQRH